MDIRERIVEAVRDHQPAPRSAACICGFICWGSAHIADVLLSLPGIAIMEQLEVDRLKQSQSACDTCGMIHCRCA